MKKLILIGVALLGTMSLGFSQRKSDRQVDFLVSYNKTEKLFTAWVVPAYDTPNNYNPENQEKGATAQFSLKVPIGFTLSDVTNVHGLWEQEPLRIGTGKYFEDAGINTGYEYYIIGKAPVETNYGDFKSGEPIPLFTFKGNGVNPEQVTVLENDDIFIKQAYDRLALNVASSFYSRSGQEPKMDAIPLEQFRRKTTMSEVLRNLAVQNGVTESLVIGEIDPTQQALVYPNPAVENVSIKFVAPKEETGVKIEMIDGNGGVLATQKKDVKMGFNTATMDVSKIQAGTYFIRVSGSTNTISKKVVKMD